MLRKLILLTAVNSDMTEARDRAVALYKAYREDETPVAPNLRWIAYSAGVKFGDKEDWKFAWEKYSNSQARTVLCRIPVDSTIYVWDSRLAVRLIGT